MKQKYSPENTEMVHVKLWVLMLSYVSGSISCGYRSLVKCPCNLATVSMAPCDTVVEVHYLACSRKVLKCLKFLPLNVVP